MIERDRDRERESSTQNHDDYEIEMDYRITSIDDEKIVFSFPFFSITHSFIHYTVYSILSSN
jgi:hypothetical protein